MEQLKIPMQWTNDIPTVTLPLRPWMRCRGIKVQVPIHLLILPTNHHRWLWEVQESHDQGHSTQCGAGQRSHWHIGSALAALRVLRCVPSRSALLPLDLSYHVLVRQFLRFGRQASQHDPMECSLSRWHTASCER